MDYISTMSPQEREGFFSFLSILWLVLGVSGVEVYRQYYSKMPWEYRYELQASFLFAGLLLGPIWWLNNIHCFFTQNLRRMVWYRVFSIVIAVILALLVADITYSYHSKTATYSHLPANELWIVISVGMSIPSVVFCYITAAIHEREKYHKPLGKGV